MGALWQCAVVCLALVAPAMMAQSRALADVPSGQAQGMHEQAAQLFEFANQTRARYGLGTLKWDPALAAGAMQHCLRMTQEGPIAHRYGGEPDLTSRAGGAGAHFSLVEENIAVGASAASIHRGWLNSLGHLANLLNPGIDRVGIAVVAHDGLLFAVADYARFAPALAQTQVEGVFAGLLRAKGLEIVKDPSEARTYCGTSGRFRGASSPSFAVRFQNADLAQLPALLEEKVAKGEYRQAAVGSCAPQNVEGDFTVYRVAVLLY